jgi:hypothetical protein
MSFNIARQVRGPAFILYRGAQFFSKGAISAPFDPETFKIAAESYGDDVDERISNLNLRVTFTPVGEFEQLTVLYPHRTRALGAPLHDIIKLGTLDTALDRWTATAHGLTTSDSVRFARVGTGSAYPTLSAGSILETTTYYVRAVDANTLKFYTTAADAAADTNALNFTAGYTGTIKIIAFYPLTIIPFDGSEPFRYENAIVTKMPSIAASAVETLFGEVEFEAYPIPNANWSDANSIYTSSGITPVTASAFDPTAIYTLPYTGVWGATFPWSNIGSMNGWRFEFPMSLEPLTEDSVGIISRQLASLTATVTATPKGITHGDLLTKLAIQGGTAARGQTLISAADDLDVTGGTSVYIRLYNAALRRGQVGYTSKADLIGECVWQSKRQFVAGVADPVFFVGSSPAP